jgi:uncharacterized protein YegL
MASLGEFTRTGARPLPVLLLADVSGSMSPDSKIGALNRAIREMLDTFRGEDDVRAEIHVGVISFGGTVREHLEPKPAREVVWQDLTTSGGTPMGEAFNLAAALMEDKKRLSSRCYRPMVVLMSDGQPTDRWEEGLERLNRSERAMKADRMALAIGADADDEVLTRFVSATSGRVFRSDEARQIHSFLRYITVSATQRSRSRNPDEAPPAPSVDLEAIV